MRGQSFSINISHQNFQVIFLGTVFFVSHFCFKSIRLHLFESSSIILCNGLGMFCFVLDLSLFNSWKVDLKKRILRQNVCGFCCVQ